MTSKNIKTNKHSDTVFEEKVDNNDVIVIRMPHEKKLQIAAIAPKYGLTTSAYARLVLYHHINSEK